eukprot:TRINITY_DN48227_c0_g1_i1.p1 TRINITY_DN48227_c0_g1~~TRINITY_DN48227_c0_g1_i1.p1  ORF type:complete len:284 (-),score=102.78 TRINITY_DN48227_c0_g1_i1:44-895(-)
MTLANLVLVAVLAFYPVHAEYPCEAEISSACPDSPKSELADCLKDSSQHENPTEISSECADFIALNSACADEIEQLCEEEYYTHETIPCLVKYKGSDDGEVSEKCSSVMKWALPAEDEEEAVTDELGMSEKDLEEKKEWQAKRKAGREAAMERMKMKEADAKKEQERRELEKFKEESPEAYADMIAQQEEEKRQQREQKKRERLLAAAAERKRRQEAGETDDDTPSASSKKGKKAKKSSWSSTIGGIVVLAVLAGVGYVMYSGAAKGGGGGRSSGKGKKSKRG